MQKTALLLLLLPALLPAQNISCALSGTVHDPANAVIPGAQIKLTGDDNGFVRTTGTNTGGFFSFPDLTPATFTMTINAPGFRTYRQQGIVMNSSDQRDLGVIHLNVGESDRHRDGERRSGCRQSICTNSPAPRITTRCRPVSPTG